MYLPHELRRKKFSIDSDHVGQLCLAMLRASIFSRLLWLSLRSSMIGLAPDVLMLETEVNKVGELMEVGKSVLAGSGSFWWVRGFVSSRIIFVTEWVLGLGGIPFIRGMG